MKVLLVGGTGVFGARLARLLVRDGHLVTLATRNLDAAHSLAQELGCSAVLMDKNDAEPKDLFGHDVVIDAAGPFDSYGDDPYRLPRAAITAGVNYLDLSDNASFCAGIKTLDIKARAAGLCVISGLSSVPALSSAAVRALTGEETPTVIDTAILPGNRSARGLSVMASILSQAGRPMKVWRGNAWTEVSGWSDPQNYMLPGGWIRQGWQIEVPDQRLFPDHFGAETVLFRAGLELGVMRYGLWAFAQLRRVIPIPVTAPVLRVFKVAADLLSPFGSGRGGMSVMVVVGQEKRWWRLLAEDGDGPFIPAIAGRALLRRKALPVGAAPALEVITLAEVEAAMGDISVRTERAVEPLAPIFPRVLGVDFFTLPEAVRTLHLTTHTSRWTGEAKVERGLSLWSRLLAWIFRFPSTHDAVPVEITKTVTADGETWLRRFGNQVFRSRLAPLGNDMTESFGPFVFRLGLNVRKGELHYPVVAGRLGPIALPRWLLPISETKEYAEGGRFHFDVHLRTPITHTLLVHYKGSLAKLPRQQA